MRDSCVRNTGGFKKREHRLGGRRRVNLSPETLVPSLVPACRVPVSTASLRESGRLEAERERRERGLAGGRVHEKDRTGATLPKGGCCMARTWGIGPQTLLSLRLRRPEPHGAAACPQTGCHRHRARAGPCTSPQRQAARLRCVRAQQGAPLQSTSPV
jgi:hypothetical protein